MTPRQAPVLQSDAGVPRRLGAGQARLLHLAAQGLLAPPRRRARKVDVIAAIARMRVLQIDTIHVVARSPYLVLFSRLGDYRSEWLGECLADGAIFECWAHEACFAPMADRTLHERHRLLRGGHWSMKHAERMRRDHAQAMSALLEHIRDDGPVKAADFSGEGSGGGGGWWGWKNEKRWLEALFALGDLMIARRDGFQRVYDLAARVLDNARRHGHVPTAGLVSEERMRREFTLGAVRALGISQARWINDYFRTGRKLKDVDLDAFVDAGELLRVDVEGWDRAGYVHADDREALAKAQAGRLRATHTTLLSPFDPVVWDRERAATMFGFDYRIECYVPAPKRRWGYYVLPVLHRGRLVGRLDAKAHRAEGRFEVKVFHLEAGVEPTAELVDAIADAIRRCAEWHRTPQVSLRRCVPAAFGTVLRRALQ